MDSVQWAADDATGLLELGAPMSLMAAAGWSLAWALVFALVFLGFYVATGSVPKGCERTSIVHHAIAMVWGAVAMCASWQSLTRPCFAPNHQHTMAEHLNLFNMGYFLYDSCHVFTWDQKFIPHHTVAIAGFAASITSDVFAVANAVNAVLTEVGSIMYNIYLCQKTLHNYQIFVTLYAASRAVLFFWSFIVLWEVLTLAFIGEYKVPYGPRWVIYAALSLQTLLMIVNIHFLLTHYKKLQRERRKLGLVAASSEDIHCQSEAVERTKQD